MPTAYAAHLLPCRRTHDPATPCLHRLLPGPSWCRQGLHRSLHPRHSVHEKPVRRVLRHVLRRGRRQLHRRWPDRGSGEGQTAAVQVAVSFLLSVQPQQLLQADFCEGLKPVS